MRLALRIESRSLESDLVAGVLGDVGDVDVLNPWDERNCTERYDLAVCLGPVSSCPRADRMVLLVMGPTHGHHEMGWDDVVVTSPRARSSAMRHFGHGVRVHLNPPPLLAMQAGRRRLMERKVEGLCASPSGPHENWPVISMSLWSLPNEGEVPFSAMEFNSLCLNGAYGIYRYALDGYDIQVRRHLALGSPVLAPRDEEVTGDLAELCLEDFDGHSIPVDPVEDKVLVEDYVGALEDIVRRK